MSEYLVSFSKHFFLMKGRKMKNNTHIKTMSYRRILNIIRKDIGSWILLVPTVIMFFITLWQPLVSGVALSFFETKGYDAVRFIGLQNYRDILTNSEFAASLINTFSYTFWSLAIGYLLPVVIAIMLNEMLHMKGIFRLMFYFPAMLPGMATSLMWYFILDPGEGGVLNMFLQSIGLPMSQWLQDPKLTIPLIVMTMTWRGFGGSMLIYLASLQGINKNLYEAASIDGAGFFKKVWYIQVPHMKNLLALMLIRQIIGVFQVMQEPLAMTSGGPNNASMSLMLSSYYYGFRYFEAGRSMAVGTVTFLILAVFTVIYQLTTRKKD